MINLENNEKISETFNTEGADTEPSVTEPSVTETSDVVLVLPSGNLKLPRIELYSVLKKEREDNREQIESARLKKWADARERKEQTRQANS